jgi:protocatechuate 3,4-dioxygenase beta subunit
MSTRLLKQAFVLIGWAAPLILIFGAMLPPSAAAGCKPTRPDALGPFYEPNAPERSSVGQGYVLGGQVKSSRDCSPIAGARIELWLAGPNGQYDDEHRATVFSGSAGSYQFTSNFPPSYSGRPPHIHVRVSAEGYGTLVTQHYPVQGQTEATFDIVLIPAP